MATTEKTTITVTATIDASVEKVWQLWTTPHHITQWNNASEDWHSPKAENDLQKGGTFNYRMEAKDGSFGFDFNGVYTEVKNHELIAYNIEGGRKVEVFFADHGHQTKITETFEAEEINPVEIQQNGWQAILDNFKKYVEAN